MEWPCRCDWGQLPSAGEVEPRQERDSGDRFVECEVALGLVGEHFHVVSENEEWFFCLFV